MVNYLKALGILRLVSEQLDPAVRGFWQGNCFGLETKLSGKELETYFCECYAPTPLVAPWNGGSGFFPGDNRTAITAIANSQDKRFQRYKNVVRIIKSWTEMPDDPLTVKDVEIKLNKIAKEMAQGKRNVELNKILSDMQEAAYSISTDLINPLLISFEDLADKAKDKSNLERGQWNDFHKAATKVRTECTRMSRSGNKEHILAICRCRLPDDVIDWLDAVYALNGEGEAFYSPILGTGANEGRLDFTNNFMQRVTELLLDKPIDYQQLLLRNAFYGDSVPGLEEGKIGQFDPGKAGGFNQGIGVENKDFVINPWDYILAFEGMLILASSMVRRSPNNPNTWLSSPFSVRFSPVGFTSSQYSESGRGEIWMPLWDKPSTYFEIKQVFGEGRSVLGKKAPKTGLEFLRAISTLGVDRGIRAFERYAFLERRGQSYVALPAGQFVVCYEQKVELLSELDGILKKLDGFLGQFVTTPASYLSVRRQIDEAVFACTLDASPYKFEMLMRALGRMEQLIAQRDRTKEPVLMSPLWGLSVEWVAACDDGYSEEIRIAASLASIYSTGKVGSIRSYMSGVAANAPNQWGDKQNNRQWMGNSFIDRLSHLLLRRIMDAERYGLKVFPLEAYVTVAPYDVMSFLEGETDDNRIEELLWGFHLVNWRKGDAGQFSRKWQTKAAKGILSRTWCLLKLLHTPHAPHPVQDVSLKRETRIGYLLMAGRIPEACEVAIHRLRISGLNPMKVDYEEELDNIRLLASLAIPISSYDQSTMESLVLDVSKNKDKGD